MKRLLKLAKEFEVKLYNKKSISPKIKELLNKAFKENKEEDLDISYNNQHFGWFIFDPIKQTHIQKDMNDFEEDDEVEDVREFVHNLKKIKLEDFKS